MTKKFVEKTTEEFTYDKEGFVIKKVTTKESYEEEVATFKPDVDMNKYIKTTGVPSTLPYFGVTEVGSGSLSITSTGTTSIQNEKADTNGITHNINISGTVDANSIAESVKKALKEAKEYKKNHLI
jgi:hypothetical protein